MYTLTQKKVHLSKVMRYFQFYIIGMLTGGQFLEEVIKVCVFGGGGVNPFCPRKDNIKKVPPMFRLHVVLIPNLTYNYFFKDILRRPFIL